METNKYNQFCLSFIYNYMFINKKLCNKNLIMRSSKIKIKNTVYIIIYTLKSSALQLLHQRRHPLRDLDFHRISTQHIKLAGKDRQGVILNNYFAMHQIIVAAADNPPGLTSNFTSSFDELCCKW